MDFTHFKILHSEIVMYCQLIEHDLKLIYAYMCDGDINHNWEFIENKTLGRVVTLLKDLDNLDKKPNISASDYNFLMQMTDNRNYWCHNAFIDFAYEDDCVNSNEYRIVCNKLDKDNHKLKYVCVNVEKVRKDICNKYRR